ncbi:hypothetical protein CANARDRAFT_74378 [[Candida] arabinofermentans NRRL YB-2248]|uniref:Uncharacterized protein n=1 Tax=[Candida] arabinofermentans NRRL YB-2248 TaxID=983967 RepID=A0A1E4SWR7_9ASCO|nr:hypothetical protein CANARDRAFT_74378 [[Candida] arabinofermentans NRRL YB-2248]
MFCKVYLLRATGISPIGIRHLSNALIISTTDKNKWLNNPLQQKRFAADVVNINEFKSSIDEIDINFEKNKASNEDTTAIYRRLVRDTLLKLSQSETTSTETIVKLMIYYYRGFDRIARLANLLESSQMPLDETRHTDPISYSHMRNLRFVYKVILSEKTLDEDTCLLKLKGLFTFLKYGISSKYQASYVQFREDLQEVLMDFKRFAEKRGFTSVLQQCTRFSSMIESDGDMNFYKFNGSVSDLFEGKSLDIKREIESLLKDTEIDDRTKYDKVLSVFKNSSAFKSNYPSSLIWLPHPLLDAIFGLTHRSTFIELFDASISCGLVFNYETFDGNFMTRFSDALSSSRINSKAFQTLYRGTIPTKPIDIADDILSDTERDSISSQYSFIMMYKIFENACGLKLKKCSTEYLLLMETKKSERSSLLIAPRLYEKAKVCHYITFELSADNYPESPPVQSVQVAMDFLENEILTHYESSLIEPNFKFFIHKNYFRKLVDMGASLTFAIDYFKLNSPDSDKILRQLALDRYDRSPLINHNTKMSLQTKSSCFLRNIYLAAMMNSKISDEELINLLEVLVTTLKDEPTLIGNVSTLSTFIEWCTVKDSLARFEKVYDVLNSKDALHLLPIGSIRIPLFIEIFAQNPTMAITMFKTIHVKNNIALARKTYPWIIKELIAIDRLDEGHEIFVMFKNCNNHYTTLLSEFEILETIKTLEWMHNEAEVGPLDDRILRGTKPTKKSRLHHSDKDSKQNHQIPSRLSQYKNSLKPRAGKSSSGNKFEKPKQSFRIKLFDYDKLG